MAMTFDIRHPECYWQTPPKFPKGVSSNLVAQHDISKVVEACADKMLWGSRYGQSRNGETHAKARDWHWLRASMLQSWWLLICMKLLTANCSKRRFRFLLQRWQKRLQLCTGCVLCTRLVLETEAHLLKLKQTCVTSKEFKDTQQILKHMLAACLYLLCLHENWSYENSWGREAMAPTTPQPSLPAAVSSLPQVMPQESPLQHREAKEGKHWRGQPCCISCFGPYGPMVLKTKYDPPVISCAFYLSIRTFQHPRADLCLAKPPPCHQAGPSMILDVAVQRSTTVVATARNSQSCTWLYMYIYICWIHLNT